jgi:hypothetical protein
MSKTYRKTGYHGEDLGRDGASMPTKRVAHLTDPRHNARRSLERNLLARVRRGDEDIEDDFDVREHYFW